MKDPLPGQEAYDAWLDALRRAAYEFVPTVTDEQLDRVHDELETLIRNSVEVIDLSMFSIELLPTAAAR